MTRHDVANAVRAALATFALVLLSVFADSSSGLLIGVAVWAVTYGWTAFKVVVKKGKIFADVRIGTYVIARVLLAAGILAVMAHHAAAFSFLAWIAAGGYVALVAVEGLIRRAYRYPGTQVVNLPGIHLRRPNPKLANGFVMASLLTPVAFWVAAAPALTGERAPLPGAVWLLALAITGGLGAAIVLEARVRRDLSRAAYEALPTMLEKYAPAFVFYWDAPRGTAYQVGMWLPYLKRIGEPFFIMVRNPNTFDQAASVSDGVPVVLARAMADMDRLVPASLTTAFYANNGAKNAHFVRYPHISHVQLLHGDSDKASSYNPVTAMFDRVYVAGQAGIDRYIEHDVDIPREKFRIVGRPQVEDVARETDPISQKKRPIVLYAPTWRGAYSDASYSSLPVAPELFDRLLERECSVIFRPHPYCERDPEFREIIQVLHAKLAAHTAETGTVHVYGEEAETHMSVVDCFNACDAMISDVSSVVVDFLYSEKPFALISMGMTEEQFIDEFPLARAGYVMDENPAGWSVQLDALLTADPLALDRRNMRVHYLGDFAPENYAEAFVAEARNQVHSQERRAPVHSSVRPV